MFEITEVPIWVWAYLGIVLGVALRTIIPYIQAIQADPTIIFQWKYVGTAIMSAFFIGFIMMPSFTIPEAEAWQIFFAAMLFAYMTNELINRRVDKYRVTKYGK